MQRNFLLCIGVMTGNSLDAVDVLLTRVDKTGEISDLCSHSLDFPSNLSEAFRCLRDCIAQTDGDMPNAIKRYAKAAKLQSEIPSTYEELSTAYHQLVNRALCELIDKAKNTEDLKTNYCLEEIDLIGFHGQTCAHYPPSKASNTKKNESYTIQIGDGQQLADLCGITVVYDFRSDDIMNGGEGAPLAPLHHQLLAQKAKQNGFFPLAFCNAGNSANVSIISLERNRSKPMVLAWDSGPFNHFPDLLMRKETKLSYDKDGALGSRGKINIELLKELFNTTVLTQSGDNFLLKAAPKSSDPQWYKTCPKLNKESGLCLEDRLRTVEYFSVYILVYSLSLVPEDIQLPTNFALSGGGWQNLICLQHFNGLLHGNFRDNPLLVEHEAAFQGVLRRIGDAVSNQGKSTQAGIIVKPSNFFGFDSNFMEARVFAHAAAWRVMGLPFTLPATTGCRTETICGILRFPKKSQSNATDSLNNWLNEFKSLRLTRDTINEQQQSWSRAAKGWDKKYAQALKPR